MDQSMLKLSIVLHSHHKDLSEQNPVFFYRIDNILVAKHPDSKRPVIITDIVDAIDFIQSYWMEKGQLVVAHDIVTLLAQLDIEF